MREIKFRAWKVHLKARTDEKGEFQGWEKIGGHIEETCPCKFFRNTSDEVLMQFTGLHDKNGKEIYEGDIVDYEGQLVKVVYGGHYRYEGFGLEGKRKEGSIGADPTWDLLSYRWEKKLEVIGNIYENPELLK